VNDDVFPALARRIELEAAISDRLNTSASRSGSRSATPAGFDIDQFRANLNDWDFDTPRALMDTVEFVVSALDEGLVQMTHPRHFGMFNPAPAYPAEAADRIAAAYNPQVCVWSHAPAAVEIEDKVIRAVGRRAGLARPGGHFTSGGAEANATALLCALTSCEPAYGDQGLAAFHGPVGIYISAEAHMAWMKIARMAGLGTQSIRIVDTDGSGRISAQALDAAIARDLQDGVRPVLVVATAGTTNAGMIDPLSQCAKIARHHGVWFHVDAAWAGALIALAQAERSPLEGLEQAHSITIDAHKWFAATMGAGMFLTARPQVLRQAFSVTSGYMPASSDGPDYYRESALWSRRFVGLRLFMILSTGGWSGIAGTVRRAQALTDRLRRRMKRERWRALNDSPAAVLCLDPPAGAPPVDQIAAAIQATGQAWIGAVDYEGRRVARICVTNARTQPGDIDRLAELLLAAARTP